MAAVTTALLTPARRFALEVLAATHPRPGRYSNGTKIGTDTRAPLIHWQAADWLIEQGLVSCSTAVAEEARLTLTDGGLAACRSAGIEVRS